MWSLYFFFNHNLVRMSYSLSGPPRLACLLADSVQSDNVRSPSVVGSWQCVMFETMMIIIFFFGFINEQGRLLSRNWRSSLRSLHQDVHGNFLQCSSISCAQSKMSSADQCYPVPLATKQETHSSFLWSLRKCNSFLLMTWKLYCNHNCNLSDKLSINWCSFAGREKKKKFRLPKACSWFLDFS